MAAPAFDTVIHPCVDNNGWSFTIVRWMIKIADIIDFGRYLAFWLNRQHVTILLCGDAGCHDVQTLRDHILSAKINNSRCNIRSVERFSQYPKLRECIKKCPRSIVKRERRIIMNVSEIKLSERIQEHTYKGKLRSSLYNVRNIHRKIETKTKQAFKLKKKW